MNLASNDTNVGSSSEVLEQVDLAIIYSVRSTADLDL